MNQPRSMLAYKRSRRLRRRIVVLYIVVTFSVWGQTAPGILPDTNLVEIGLKTEPLPVDDLIEAALRISGTPVIEIDGVADTIRDLIDEAKEGVGAGWSDAEIADYVLHFLHDQVFTLYDEFQTRVDIAVGEGTFNCVSSAVIYMIFVRSFEIPVSGVGTVDHAFCLVSLPDREVDVETTNIHGFDPGKKKEFQDSFGNVTGYSYVPPSDYAGREKIGEKELLGLILQNRISVLESKKRYGEAVGLAVDRHALAPGKATRDHMIREMANYAALLNERKEYSTAVDFLDTVIEEYGTDEALEQILGILHYNNIVVLLQAEMPFDALDAISRALDSGWISQSSAVELKEQAAERIVAMDLPTLSPEEGLELVDYLLEEGLMTPERHLEFSVMFASQIADAYARKGDYLQAAMAIETAMEKIGNDGRLEQARSAYRYNYAVEAHNSFASLFNDKKYDEAADLLRNALEQVPESEILASDLKTVRKVLSANN